MESGGRNVLIVDDDQDVPDILAEILTGWGHRVRVARDGREGLQFLHEELPDVIVLDVEMPHLTGPQMMHRMILENAGKEKIPVVLVSGIVGLPALARRVGTTYYLAKPFDLDALLELLRRALTEQQPPAPGHDAHPT